MKSYGVTIQMKATEQQFPVVLFIMLYKMILTFESLDENLWSGHLNTSYQAILSQGTIYCKSFLQSEIRFFFSVVFTILHKHFRLWMCLIPVTQEICHLSNQTCDLQ